MAAIKKAFVTEALVETYEDLEGRIFIPSNALCAYLDRAEDRESTIKQERGVVKPLKAYHRIATCPFLVALESPPTSE